MSLETLLEAARFVERKRQPGPRTREFHPYAKTPPEDTPMNQEKDGTEKSEKSESGSDEVKDRRRMGGYGTREVHNKLEKNRRAHLKECFENLKTQIPSMDDKKTSNLAILRGALRYIQMLKRKEKDLEQELQGLAASKSGSQEIMDNIKQELLNMNIQLDINTFIQATEDEDNHSVTTASAAGEDPILSEDDEEEDQAPPLKKPKPSATISQLIAARDGLIQEKVVVTQTPLIVSPTAVQQQPQVALVSNVNKRPATVAALTTSMPGALPKPEMLASQFKSLAMTFTPKCSIATPSSMSSMHIGQILQQQRLVHAQAPETGLSQNQLKVKVLADSQAPQQQARSSANNPTSSPLALATPPASVQFQLQPLVGAPSQASGQAQQLSVANVQVIEAPVQIPTVKVTQGQPPQQLQMQQIHIQKAAEPVHKQVTAVPHQIQLQMLPDYILQPQPKQQHTVSAKNPVTQILQQAITQRVQQQQQQVQLQKLQQQQQKLQLQQQQQLPVHKLQLQQQQQLPMQKLQLQQSGPGTVTVSVIPSSLPTTTHIPVSSNPHVITVSTGALKPLTQPAFKPIAQLRPAVAINQVLPSLVASPTAPVLTASVPMTTAAQHPALATLSKLVSNAMTTITTTTNSSAMQMKPSAGAPVAFATVNQTPGVGIGGVKHVFTVPLTQIAGAQIISPAQMSAITQLMSQNISKTTTQVLTSSGSGGVQFVSPTIAQSNLSSLPFSPVTFAPGLQTLQTGQLRAITPSQILKPCGQLPILQSQINLPIKPVVVVSMANVIGSSASLTAMPIASSNRVKEETTETSFTANRTHATVQLAIKSENVAKAEKLSA